MLRCALVVWLLVAVLAPSGGVAAAQSSGSVTWQRYDVGMQLQPNGSLTVDERQTIQFRGTFRHGYRIIPLDRTTGITDVSVVELRNNTEVAYAPGSERANTFSTSRAADGLQVDWWFPPTSGTETRTFSIRYKAQGATRIYADTAQVFWKAIYAERGGDVLAGTVTLTLPQPVPASDVVSATYLYGDSSREIGSASVADPRTLRFESPHLESGTGLEVRAQMPVSIVPAAQAPAWQAEADRADWIQHTAAPIGTFLALLLTLGILASGGVALFVLWYGQGREPNVGAVPRTLQEPPSHLPGPLVGTLVDGVADLEDAVATLVDLAQRGVLRMKHERGDVRLSLQTPTEDPSLRPYERVLLVALFGQDVADGELMLSSARHRFAAAVPVLEDRLYQAIADEGLFVANPEQTRRRYMGLGWTLVGVGALLAIGAGILLGWAVPIAWLPGAALALIGLALVWLARHMPRRTPRGALEAARWTAFREHLRKDEQDAEAEQFLPYAVAFGIDREFLHRLAPPEPLDQRVGSRAWRQPGGVIFLPGGWYGGSPRPSGGRSDGGWDAPEVGPPSPQGWSDALADLLNSASEAMAHGGGSGRWGGGGWGGGGGGGGGRGGFN